MELTTSLSSDKLLAYLLRESTPEPKKIARLTELIGQRKLIIYGCGDGFISFSVFVLNKFCLCPEVLLDIRFPEPTVINGVPAMSPEHYRPTEELATNSVVIITVGKKQYHDEIITTLNTLGFTYILLSSDIYEYHLIHAPRGFELIGPKYFREHIAEIEAAYALFEDEHSREVFTQVLRTHIECIPVPIRHESLKWQYFPNDIKLSRGGGRFINCGSYDGDTVRQANIHLGKIDALACFEPDGKNFSKLIRMLGENTQGYAKSTIAFPCGVWDNEAQLRFAGGERINSRVFSGGNTLVQCVALDHVLPDFMPTFINMDIEGAEPRALAGSSGLIRKYQPDLAICVYHLPEHLWQIPLQISQYVPTYRFYLRNYTGFVAETVLYATL